MTLNGEDMAPFDLFVGPPFTYLLDPFAIGGPGDLNFLLGIFPPETRVYDPVTDTVTRTYLGDFSGFGPRTFDATTGDSFIEVLLSVYLDAPLPMQVFTETDPDTGAIISSTPYFDGPLSISRITLGTVDGPAVPVPAVPLPASGLLILAGLGALGALRRQSGPRV